MIKIFTPADLLMVSYVRQEFKFESIPKLKEAEKERKYRDFLARHFKLAEQDVSVFEYRASLGWKIDLSKQFALLIYKFSRAFLIETTALKKEDHYIKSLKQSPKPNKATLDICYKYKTVYRRNNIYPSTTIEYETLFHEDSES
jgi:hypothetical protein